MMPLSRFKKPWLSRQQIIAGCLSMVLLSLALFTLWLGHWLPSVTDEKIEIREVVLMTPPPPPPPPPSVQQPVIETPITIQVQGAGPPLQLVEINKRVEISKPKLPTIDTRQTQWQTLEIDWNAFDLNDLDGLPNLLTPLQLTLPKSLSRRGIKHVLIKLDVLIDEQGKVTLINIIENPHPELNKEIERLVRNSRFTSPRKNNQVVRARFIWPVEIKS